MEKDKHFVGWLLLMAPHPHCLLSPTLTFGLIYGQQMQRAGPSSPSCSSTSACFPLGHLNNTAECGSETTAEPEKREVRANNTVSSSQRDREGKNHQTQQ